MLEWQIFREVGELIVSGGVPEGVRALRVDRLGPDPCEIPGSERVNREIRVSPVIALMRRQANGLGVEDVYRRFGRAEEIDTEADGDRLKSLLVPLPFDCQILEVFRDPVLSATARFNIEKEEAFYERLGTVEEDKMMLLHNLVPNLY